MTELKLSERKKKIKENQKRKLERKFVPPNWQVDRTQKSKRENENNEKRV